MFDDTEACETKKNACHNSQLPGLRRVEGQVRGVINMIESGKYCVDIIDQIKAARGALRSIEAKVLATHMRTCLKDALHDEAALEEKINELVNLAVKKV